VLSQAKKDRASLENAWPEDDFEVLQQRAIQERRGLAEPPQRSSVRGLIDTGGHLAPGGLGLKLIRTGTGERFSAVTENDGTFQFPPVGPGSYQLNGDFPGFAPLREGPFQISSGTPTDVGTLTPVWLISTPSEARVVGLVRVTEVEVTDAGLVDAGSVTAHHVLRQPGLRLPGARHGGRIKAVFE